MSIHLEPVLPSFSKTLAESSQQKLSIPDMWSNPSSPPHHAGSDTRSTGMLSARRTLQGLFKHNQLLPVTSDVFFLVIFNPLNTAPLTPTLPLGYQYPLVYNLFGIELNSTLWSFFPHCNSSWIKSAFTTVTTAQFWRSLMGHHCYLASQSFSNLLCKME